jgi:threonine synthase
MSHVSLKCTACGNQHESNMQTIQCPDCGEPLDCFYESDHQSGDHTWAGIPIPMPYHQAEHSATLGEGNTPVVPVNWVAEEVGLQNVEAKLEYMNPTGSFKDRGTAVMMSVAKELGVTEVVEDSSGNAGASVSAYAGRAGITAHVFAPANAPEAKLQQIRVYGAQTHSIEGPREATTQAAIDYYQQQGLVYASHNLSPYFLEGTKTFAYELAAGPVGVPDHVIIPVGNGALFIGAWKGFQELLAAGRIDRMPKMHAIQADGVMPVAAAFAGQLWTLEDSKPTIAGGISVATPPRKQQVLDILAASGGRSIAVDDESIVRWQKALASREGIYCEPTSAAAFAGLQRLAEESHIAPEDRALVAVTGFGLKDAPPV